MSYPKHANKQLYVCVCVCVCVCECVWVQWYFPQRTTVKIHSFPKQKEKEKRLGWWFSEDFRVEKQSQDYLKAWARLGWRNTGPSLHMAGKIINHHQSTVGVYVFDCFSGHLPWFMVCETHYLCPNASRLWLSRCVRVYVCGFVQESARNLSCRHLLNIQTHIP